MTNDFSYLILKFYDLNLSVLNRIFHFFAFETLCFKKILQICKKKDINNMFYTSKYQVYN